MTQRRDILNTIMNHRSIRSYKPDMIPQADLDNILNAAIHAPSSVNGQQWSVIVITDKAKKEKLAELTALRNGEKQQWVEECPVFLLFVMDYYKIATQLKALDKPFGHIDSIEATMVGCVDIGIAFSNAMNVAESMGYGIVPIGAVRGKPREIISMLNLPQGTYPILGMCLGLPNQDPALKPRMPKEAFVHQETYNQDTKAIVDSYDKIMKEYMAERTKGEDIRNWSDTTAIYYANAYYPFEKEVLAEQGFPNKV